jgi:hypothetical protein
VAGPLEITPAEMSAAVDCGDAALLGPGLEWVAWHRNGWWVEFGNGWARVLDEAAERDLDLVAARLAEADAIARDHPGARPDAPATGAGASGRYSDSGAGAEG